MGNEVESTWYLYILRCGDGSLYTGITTDVSRRLDAHIQGKGAKYTRGRGPLTLAYQEVCGTHSQALRRELAVKALSRDEKQRLIQENLRAEEKSALTNRRSSDIVRL